MVATPKPIIPSDKVPLPGIERGQVYWVRIGKHTVGSEEYKQRPWVVVSNPEYHELLPVLIAVPLTTASHTRDLAAARIIIEPEHVIATQFATAEWDFLRPLDPVRMIALTEQVRTLSPARLEGAKPVAKISDDRMSNINAALAYILAL